MEEDWQPIDQMLSEAAGILCKCNALKLANCGPRLKNTISMWHAEGKMIFDEAMEKEKTLDDEQRKKLWKAQIRNINATEFDQLLTSKQYHSSLHTCAHNEHE
jgi:hypothetical protein